MPPQVSPTTTKEPKEVPFPSSIGFKYPAHRDNLRICGDLWLEDKQITDGAEGLWRIHNRLYDLTTWVDKHPGGRDWIRLTKGTDVTEHFESYHISREAELILPKFYVRDAKSPRNSPFTFAEDGFYRTLKNRVRKTLTTIPKPTINISGVITDLLMVSYVTTAVLAAVTNSYLVGFVSGMQLSMMAIAAHNFFHQKDNRRMYYFDLIFLSHRDWRISHAMSHHPFPNTVADLEVSLLEPYVLYLPSKNTFWRRVLSCIILPLVWTFLTVGSQIRKYIFFIIGTIKEVNIKTELIPYTILVIMYFFGGQSLRTTFVMWLWIILTGSFCFGFTSFNSAHHHPKLFHDGDTPRSDLDWGIFQLDAVTDRPSINASSFLVLISFGEHVLHHLFPTLDHSRLHNLYPDLQRTCAEFNVEHRMTSQWNLIQGQFAQMLRMDKNPNDPGTKWKWYKTFWEGQRRNFWESVEWLMPKNKTV